MAINFNFKNTHQSCLPKHCIDKLGCPDNICPDFLIKRHDTKPPFRVAVEDCDGPLDVQGLVVEVNMWAIAKLKKSISPADTTITFADGIGFGQLMVGDIILMDRTRAPEFMLVTGFDEDNLYVKVQRGYRNTTATNWKKGNKLRIFRTMNSPAQGEVVFEDIPQVDGTTLKNQLTAAHLVYEWKPEDTCMPGCYWLEFKILKMKDLVLFLPGGHWEGPRNRDSDLNYWTGTGKTDSSVLLSYDSPKDRYLLPTSAWLGTLHLGSDNSFYTGTVHNDGSVFLDRTEHPSVPSTVYQPVPNVQGVSVVSITTEETISTVFPSLGPSLAISGTQLHEFYGCLLGEDVEWERRLPLTGEGFLIKISDSATREY